MTPARLRFCVGFLQGSMLGFGLLAVGFLGWVFSVWIGWEKDRSLAGFLLVPIYVLSFGLGGGAFGLLRRGDTGWLESVVACTGALTIVLLGCGIIAFLAEAGLRREWYWGAGGLLLLCLLLLFSFTTIRRRAEPSSRTFGMNLLSTFWLRAKEKRCGLGWIVVTFLSLWLTIGIGTWFFVYRLATQMSMETWASYAGGLQARVWFQDGRYRLFELSASEKLKFTGRTNGPFEIWTWTHYTNNSSLTVQTADQKFVDAFNTRMRQLWESREREGEQ